MYDWTNDQYIFFCIYTSNYISISNDKPAVNEFSCDYTNSYNTGGNYCSNFNSTHISRTDINNYVNAYSINDAFFNVTSCSLN